jgi:hypothetical protein
MFNYSASALRVDLLLMSAGDLTHAPSKMELSMRQVGGALGRLGKPLRCRVRRRIRTSRALALPNGIA